MYTADRTQPTPHPEAAGESPDLLAGRFGAVERLEMRRTKPNLEEAK